ncbi:tetratricopeptide repeat protein [Ancylobacter sp. A5.8]|uniref:tetratricopeptide repeat protein n=1 Tax=Ancylobacter gelatini TaxID=2919920 RepID=UPI001F4DC78E|nr:tetratricopeptide repeat protein [Ancylobacter gelatini]MCJ8144157.1 tetratricopeptide repeat protein [Ancylobacter gelatini]
MADIFHEIDEDLRRERFSRIWSRYGLYIIGLAVLIVVAVAGWRGYEWWKLREDQASGARFEAAMQLAEQGKNAEAEAAFAALEKDGTSGYRLLARFRAATDLARTDRTAAIADYDAISGDGSVPGLMRDVATIRAALLLVDTAPLSEIEGRVKPLDTPDGAFRHSAREILGLAQYKAGDTEAASATFTAILGDPESPPGLRRRAELMRTLAAGGAPMAADVAAPAPLTPEVAVPATAAPEVPAPGEAVPAPAAPAVQ